MFKKNYFEKMNKLLIRAFRKKQKKSEMGDWNTFKTQKNYLNQVYKTMITEKKSLKHF